MLLLSIIVCISMVSWWNDIQYRASVWRIKLNIKRKFYTVTPHHLNPVPQTIDIYAAVYSGSRALRPGTHYPHVT